jgi:putative transposase
MATRLPASQRTREELTALIEGRLSTGSAKDKLVKLATRLIVEEALEGEATDAVGREYYDTSFTSTHPWRVPPEAWGAGSACRPP